MNVTYGLPLTIEKIPIETYLCGQDVWRRNHNKQEQQRDDVVRHPSNFPGRLCGSFDQGWKCKWEDDLFTVPKRPAPIRDNALLSCSMKVAQQRSFLVKYLKPLPCKLGHLPNVCKVLQTLVGPLFKPVPVWLDWEQMSTWKNFLKKSWLWSLLLKGFSNWECKRKWETINSSSIEATGVTFVFGYERNKEYQLKSRRLINRCFNCVKSRNIRNSLQHVDPTMQPMLALWTWREKHWCSSISDAWAGSDQCGVFCCLSSFTSIWAQTPWGTRWEELVGRQVELSPRSAMRPTVT